MVSSLLHDTCLNKKFSIVFYVVLDSAFTWGFAPQPGPPLNPTDLNNAVNYLNSAFSRICVTFQNCSTVVIPNYNYNYWSSISNAPYVISNWYTPNAINVYLTGEIVSPYGALGYTNFPGAGPNIIVLTKEYGLGTEFIHQMGHFFGLPDTYAEIGSPVTPGPPSGVTTYEYVDRTNCYTNGDGFCDTDADPYPTCHMTYPVGVPPSPCAFIKYGAQDGKGEYYTPPSENYMSEYNCRCRFSQEQYNFMARIMITQRLNVH